MLLCGLQKLTLLDYPGKTACTVFTGGCDLRCPFCHNASLVLRPQSCPPVTEEELFAFLKKRRGLLDGVCVTGGEPTLQKDLPAFLAKLRALGFLVKLDTNGTRPEVLKALLQKGLVDMVAMDVKAGPKNYAAAVGLPGFDLAPVNESVRLLLAGGVPYEFRTTCVKGLHTAGDFAALGQWLCGAQNYFLQNFVDSGDLVGPAGQALSEFSQGELETFLTIVQKNIPAAQLRGV